MGTKERNRAVRAAGTVALSCLLAMTIIEAPPARAGLPSGEATLKFTVTNHAANTITLDSSRTTVGNGRFSNESGNDSATPPQSISSGKTVTTYATISNVRDPFSGTLAYVDGGVNSGVQITWNIPVGGNDPNINCDGYGNEGGAYDCTGFNVSYPNQQTWPITATVGCPGASGTCPWTFAGTFGTSGSGPGQFNQPTAVDQNGCTGEIYVADSGNGRWQVWNQNGFGGSASTPGMSHPVGISVYDPCGTPQVVVVDDQAGQVFTFTPGGQLIRAFGAGMLSNPQDVTADFSSGYLYVADTGNNRIVVFTIDGTLVQTIGQAGSGMAQFSAPQAVNAEQPTAPHQPLAVADTGNRRLQLLNTTGGWLDFTGFPAQSLGYSDSYLVAAAGSSVALYDISSGLYFAPAGQFGATGTSPGAFGSSGAGDGGGAWAPGVFYLADPSNDRFQVFYLPESLSRIASRSARVRAGRAGVAVRCVAPRRRCRGNVRLYRRGRVVGRRAFSIAPRRSGTVRVRLDAATRNAFARGRAGRVRAVLHGRARPRSIRAAGPGVRFVRREALEISALRLGGRRR